MEITPSPKDIGIFVLCVAALVPVINQFAIWFGKKQKREVSFEEKYALADDLNTARLDLAGRIDDVDEKVNNLKESIIANGETRRAAIEAKVEAARQEARAHNSALQDKIACVDKSVAGLQTSMDLHRQLLAGMSAKLDSSRI